MIYASYQVPRRSRDLRDVQHPVSHSIAHARRRVLNDNAIYPQTIRNLFRFVEADDRRGVDFRGGTADEVLERPR